MADYEFNVWAVTKTISVQSASEHYDSEVKSQAQSVAGYLAVITM